MGTGFERGQIAELVFPDAMFSADGRVNINSKGTTDHQGDV
jgi:hypothetical protein